MPLAGKAMLVNFMNVDPAGEDDFNRWYDKEHLAERVAIEGFIEARRYVAVEAAQKYLGIYTTETLEVLDSPAYRERLANQTAWSLKNFENFRDATRACARVTLSKGTGRGSALAFLRLRPGAQDASGVRDEIAGAADAAIDLDRVLSVHLVESDPELSVPLTPNPDAAAGSGDWYVLIDATGIEALLPAIEALALDRFGAERLRLVSTGVYRLLGDISKAELRS
jgi:hypothetical protein